MRFSSTNWPALPYADSSLNDHSRVADRLMFRARVFFSKSLLTDKFAAFFGAVMLYRSVIVASSCNNTLSNSVMRMVVRMQVHFNQRLLSGAYAALQHAAKPSVEATVKKNFLPLRLLMGTRKAIKLSFSVLSVGRVFKIPL